MKSRAGAMANLLYAGEVLVIAARKYLDGERDSFDVPISAVSVPDKSFETPLGLATVQSNGSSGSERYSWSFLYKTGSEKEMESVARRIIALHSDKGVGSLEKMICLEGSVGQKLMKSYCEKEPIKNSKESVPDKINRGKGDASKGSGGEFYRSDFEEDDSSSGLPEFDEDEIILRQGRIRGFRTT